MSLINSSDRFAIFGGRGMAGSAICRALERKGYKDQLHPSRQDLDLLDGLAVDQWMLANKPDVVVRIDPRYFRPAEVETLLGDPSKAKEKLGWTPTTTLEELVAEMVTTDKEEAQKEAYLKRKGFNVVGARE